MLIETADDVYLYKKTISIQLSSMPQVCVSNYRLIVYSVIRIFVRFFFFISLLLLCSASLRSDCFDVCLLFLFVYLFPIHFFFFHASHSGLSVSSISLFVPVSTHTLCLQNYCTACVVFIELQAIFVSFYSAN